MTRTVYLNGEYLPETEARVSICAMGSSAVLMGCLAKDYRGRTGFPEKHAPRSHRTSQNLRQFLRFVEERCKFSFCHEIHHHDGRAILRLRNKACMRMRKIISQRQQNS